MTNLDVLAVPLRGTSLIEASAGTGKTYTITTLYLRLLLEQQLTVGQILVVTFTNAATAELRSRIRMRLRAAVDAFAIADAPCDETLAALRAQRSQAGTLDDDRARLLIALYSFDEAAIFTIHGFCQRMLHDNAFESGVAFDVELVTEQALLRDEVVGDFFVRELVDAPHALIEGVRAAHLDPPRLAALAQLVMRDPHLRILPEPTASPLPSDGNGTAGDAVGVGEIFEFQRRFLSYAREQLRERRQRTNTQSFDDLLHRLSEALSGVAGPALAARIAARFPAALIDEFQDTDPLQYDIFRRVYRSGGDTLLLIADPKQAIFAFRGADVFAYMAAKRDAGQHAYTLPVNRRSGPRLVHAVNTLFTGARAPFVFDAVAFRPVEPAAGASDEVRDAAGPMAPLQVVFVRRRAGVRLVRNRRPPQITKEWGRGDLPRLLAAHIVRLLDGKTLIEGRRVAPGDIAVLCRTNDYARTIQAALRACQVPTALQGDDSVLESGEAEDLERVLRAVAEPGDTRAVRAALVGTLMGVGAADLLALDQQEAAWDAWVERFHRWHDVWTERGFMPAFRSMLDEWDVRQRLLRLSDGERRLTNILHLGELLHAAATEGNRGPLALIEWLSQLRRDDAAKIAPVRDAAQVRLESDARAVKLITIHGSKGLEYPVVICPQLWDVIRPANEPVHFHDPAADDRATLDLGSAKLAVHRSIARREALAEDLRLLYVALTRARHLCIVVWGAFYDGEGSALGYILHQPPAPSASADLAAETKERLRRFDDDTLRADLEGIAERAGGAIAITDLSHDVNVTYQPDMPPAVPLACREAHRRLSTAWRASSFSGLAGAMEARSGPAEEGIDRDDLDGAVEILATAPLDDADTAILLADLPTGTRAGQMVHELLQYLDFQDAAASPLQQQAFDVLARYGLEDQWADTLARGVAAALDSPLATPSGPLTLRQVPRHHRLNELEFVFPVAHAEAPGETAALLTAGQLANLFAHHAQPPVPDTYAARIRQLGFAPLAGYLRGFIDLVFEHENRWYIVDYKSNLLGKRAGDYRAPRLITAMEQHHYFLQYHLYTVAVHRYLQQRLSAYDYEQHFGGIFYLFLRGMSPDRPGSGVFWDRPSRRFVEALSALFAESGVRGSA